MVQAEFSELIFSPLFPFSLTVLITYLIKSNTSVMDVSMPIIATGTAAIATIAAVLSGSVYQNPEKNLLIGITSERLAT